MPGTVTLSEAALMMGWRSRSTLYRLRKLGSLDHYLAPGPGSAEVLLLEPQGRPPLREYLASVVRLQHGSPLERLQRPAPVDPLDVVRRELAQARAATEAIRARELAWVAEFDKLRDYVTRDLAMDLMRRLPDPVPVGDVMVVSRDLLVAQLEGLNRCELASRFPR
jgi:hypothetical protein